MFGNNQKKSKVITARNPFRKDEEVVDYDMDSEDEWAEENGEDLENKKDSSKGLKRIRHAQREARKGTAVAQAERAA